ncbi:coiled-coil domain-containing protein [Rhizohabitans arisaemae]|uniref:coiled-coil domain-containing protein n=1 Tax=Rhizohabitans arisaemae TaxID=2720610 RepID=UPI0024B0D435|nr:hypothetical protein [Rhizohabitans arisaemae]
MGVRRARVAAFLVTATVLTTGFTHPAQARPAGNLGIGAPKPSEKELLAQVKKLEKQVDALIATYTERRVAHQRAEKAEKAAQAKVAEAGAAFEAARKELGSLITAIYQYPHFNSIVGLINDGGTQDFLSRTSLLRQLSDTQLATLERFMSVRDTLAQARDAASARTTELLEAAAEAKEKRRAAEDLINELKRKLDSYLLAPGRRKNGTWVPELPTGSDNITPRTRLMLNAVKNRFDLSFVVGCYRVDPGGGEHPQGRACDFMLSSAGRMPSAGQVKLGDEISAWTMKNARKLGVKYIIYRQKIWHGGSKIGAWRAMSDRGSITQNHYDHVHISMH